MSIRVTEVAPGRYLGVSWWLGEAPPPLKTGVITRDMEVAWRRVARVVRTNGPPTMIVIKEPLLSRWIYATRRVVRRRGRKFVFNPYWNSRNE